MTLETLEKANEIQEKIDNVRELQIAVENIDEFRLTPRTNDTTFNKVYLNYLPDNLKTKLVEVVVDLVDDYINVLKKDLEAL